MKKNMSLQLLLCHIHREYSVSGYNCFSTMGLPASRNPYSYRIDMRVLNNVKQIGSNGSFKQKTVDMDLAVYWPLVKLYYHCGNFYIKREMNAETGARIV